MPPPDTTQAATLSLCPLPAVTSTFTCVTCGGLSGGSWSQGFPPVAGVAGRSLREDEPGRAESRGGDAVVAVTP